jgi:hypothetical protein
MSGAMATWVGVLLLFAPLLIAQEPQKTSPSAGSAFPADVIPAQQLIAWSWMQQPQPTPQPTHPPDMNLSQAGPQPESLKIQIVQPPENQDVTGRVAITGQP